MSSPLDVRNTNLDDDHSGANSLNRIMDWKYGPLAKRGWGPTLRARFNYATPDDLYETFVFDYVSTSTRWLDVGCGRDIFPSNRPVAQILSRRCKLLVGLDPDDNIDENSFVHRREKTVLENYKTELQFDLITMRMVAEHIRDPEKVVGALSRLAKSGGHVIIYTVSKWSPVSILASATPTIVHRIAKRALWQTEDRDTFPVIYKMNTRPALTRLFGRAGFREVTFKYLDDCRTFQRWKITNFIELTAWRILQKLNIRYPESCILAVYQKQ